MFTINSFIKKSADVEEVEIEPEVVEKGLWKPARVGRLIKCRQWRVLEGNFRFLCNGRLMFGPGCCFLWWFIVIHLITTFVVFISFEVGPYFDPSQPGNYVIPGLALLLSICTICSVFQVVLTEPGCIPRPPPEEAFENYINYQVDKKPEQIVAKVLVVNEKRLVHVFCEKCQHFRPLRTHHCDKCNCCIDRYDHHCFSFGTCIGKRNYGAFLRFLLSANILFIMIGTISTINLISHWRRLGFKEAVGKSPTIFVLLAATLMPPLGLVQVFYLLIRHFHLLLTDQTLHEKRNKLRPMGERTALQIFIAGLRNCYKLLLCPPSKSQIRPHDYVNVVAIPKPLKRLNGEKSKKRSVFSCIAPRAAAGDLTITDGVNRRYRVIVPSLFQDVRAEARRIRVIRRTGARVYPANENVEGNVGQR